MRTQEFPIALACLDFSLGRFDYSMEAACAVAAYTQTPPALALKLIHARVMAGERQISDHLIESMLVKAYMHYAKEEKCSLAAQKALDTKDISRKSPIPPNGITPDEFLRSLYQPEQRIGIVVNRWESSIWTHESNDASIPHFSKTSVRFWPMPCSKIYPWSRCGDLVDSWTFAAVTGDSAEGFAGLIDQIPILAIIATGVGFKKTSAILRFKEDARNRKAWMTKQKGLMTLFEKNKVKAGRLDKLIPLPGTIGRDGIPRLVYFNPAAPAVA